MIARLLLFASVACALFSAVPAVAEPTARVRGLLRVHGLKIGAIHRNRYAARVLELA
jgi:hypothetical protein